MNSYFQREIPPLHFQTKENIGEITYKGDKGPKASEARNSRANVNE